MRIPHVPHMALRASGPCYGREIHCVARTVLLLSRAVDKARQTFLARETE